MRPKLSPLAANSRSILGVVAFATINLEGLFRELNCVHSATLDRIIRKPFRLCGLVVYMFQS